jgi:hypothetical protein
MAKTFLVCKSIIIALFLFFPSKICLAQTDSFTVSGTIKDKDNNPIPSVQVLLCGNNSVISIYTDANGDYEFRNVLGGTRYTIMPCQFEKGGIIDSSKVSGDTIVEIALNELGNTDGPSPGKYHGHDGGWCSEFVSWVYLQAGDPFTGGASDGGACTEDWAMSTLYRVIAGFGRKEYWQVQTIEVINANWQAGPDNPLAPQPGDYVFFSNTTGIDRAHSGLVKEMQGTSLLTVEGNVSNLVKELTRSNWRTYQDGNTVVKGIGYRRIVSNISFNPGFFYGRVNSDTTQDFSLFHINPTTAISGNKPLLASSDRFHLYQNQPNPFNTVTVISCNLPVQCSPILSIYDVSGKLVQQWRIKNQAPGLCTVLWNCTDMGNRKLSEGIYLYRLHVIGKFSRTRIMTLSK